MQHIPEYLNWSSSRHILNQISDAVMVVGLDGRIIEMNAELCRRVGYERSELLGQRPSIWHEDSDIDTLTEAIINECLAKGHWRGEVPYQDSSGSNKRSDLFAQTLVNDDGDVIAVLSVSRDITERTALEEQLRQDQKTRAIGSLTGGIAHDFNNILAIIQGNLELLIDDPSDEKTANRLAVALEATKQGVSLTQRLLAYARQQPLSPEPIDANIVLNGLRELLASSLSEAIDLEIVSAGGLWKCLADRAQLETVILNLAINARDAMPSGGKLTLETFNARLDDVYARSHDEVEPGQYVCCAFTDSGVGMTLDVAEKAFDPFFTTKDVGEGSGLGLSMAYGFAKQSGGHIKIYSELNKGTTVKLYLPRTLESSPTLGRIANSDGLETLFGKKFLVVEDNERLRETIVSQLTSLGSQSDQAGSSSEAIELCSKNASYDILLIDVVLPGTVNGPQLASSLSKFLPDTPVVFMSGYTENAVIHHGRLDPGVILLQKPFSRSELAFAMARAWNATVRDQPPPA